MKVAATVVEREKQVFYERPRSKVKISTPLDSDAEEAPSLEASGAPLPLQAPPPPVQGRCKQRRSPLRRRIPKTPSPATSSESLGLVRPCPLHSFSHRPAEVGAEARRRGHVAAGGAKQWCSQQIHRIGVMIGTLLQVGPMTGTPEPVATKLSTCIE